MSTNHLGCLAALSCVLSPALHAADIHLGCDRFELLLAANGSARALELTSEGTEGRRPFPAETSAAGSPFTVELQESVYGLKDGKRRRVQLDALSQVESKLLLGGTAEPRVRLTFAATNKGDYLTLRLVSVQTPDGEHATRLEFRGFPGLRTFPLNPEVILQGNSGTVVFQGLLRRSLRTPLGGIALWHPATEQVDDEIFYRVWVNEALPHPKVEERWTVARAKRWVSEYIETFRNYSEIYITGDSLDDLKRCVDYAARMKMRAVYMHLMTWAGRYWPEGEELYRVNPKLFPQGRADFRKLVDYAKSEGLRVGIRTLSNSVSLKSREFLGSKPDRRLAHFWRGSLVEAIGPASDEVHIRSDKTLPTSFAAKGFGAKTNPPSIRFLLIDDEILQYADYEEHADGSLTLQVARGRDKKLVRGYGPTVAAAHPAGAPVKILSGHFRDHVAPDHDSELLDEIAQRYADFNNEMELVTSSFDGLYLYTFQTPYGSTRLPDAVYSRLDHPTWCFTSNGLPKWGFFEIRLNSVRRALGLKNDLLEGNFVIPQRMRLMIGLHQDHWAAPGPYGHTYCIVPNAVRGYLWCTVQNQSSTHELTKHVFENFGLVDHFATAIARWRRYGPDMPANVKRRIWSGYDRKSNSRYPWQIEHFRFEERDKELDVVPFRPMRRVVGDRGWFYIQEHGPVYTYQYLRPNTDGLVQAENPYYEQVPEFILRVMKDFDRQMLSAYLEAHEAGNDNAGLREHLADILGNSQVTASSAKPRSHGGEVNHRLMPAVKDGRSRKFDPGKVLDVKLEGNGLRLSYRNTSNREKVFDAEKRPGDHLLSYRVNSSLENAQGLGLILTGDGSKAMFVVRLMNNKVRDYGIPLDFKGKRYVEIPSAQASWSDSRIPVTSLWKRWNNPRISTVALGFARVPARTRASVFIEDIGLLPERRSALRNPSVHCGSGALSIEGVIPSDRYLWYRGGNSAEVFDLNWNKLEQLPVRADNAAVPRGRSDIRLENHNESGDPWLECQFFVRDKPIYTIRSR